MSGAHMARPPAKSTARTCPAKARSQSRRGAMSSVMAASGEDRLGQEGRDDPVGRVHDLADLEIDGYAADDVGLLAGEAALAHDVLDHVAHGLLGGGEKVGPHGHGRV